MSLLFIQVAKYVCKLTYTKLLTASVVLQSAGGLAVLVTGLAYKKKEKATANFLVLQSRCSVENMPRSVADENLGTLACMTGTVWPFVSCLQSFSDNNTLLHRLQFSALLPLAGRPSRLPSWCMGVCFNSSC